MTMKIWDSVYICIGWFPGLGELGLEKDTSGFPWYLKYTGL